MVLLVLFLFMMMLYIKYTCAKYIIIYFNNNSPQLIRRIEVYSYQ